MLIVIMVLSFDREPYAALTRAQLDTWDAQEPHGNMQTIFYSGGEKLEYFYPHHNSVVAKYDCSDDYYQMQWKFKLCLSDYLSCHKQPFILFRTNSSSYVNKSLLRKHVETLPTTRLYSGWSLGSCVSGAGILLSSDVCSVLADNIEPGVQMEEDCYAGKILLNKGYEILDDKSRVDVTDVNNTPLDRYHYRFKSEDRLQDAANMIELHKRIQNGK